MKMIVESMMECRLAGETEVLGENLTQCHFCPSQNPTCPPGFEPGPPRWDALLITCLASSQKMEAIRSSETSVNFYPSAFHDTPEGTALYNNLFHKLGPKIFLLFPLILVNVVIFIVFLQSFELIYFFLFE
jgi:hypothetical protein